MISVSMENSLATIGGFCCGTSFVVDHQVCHDIGRISVIHQTESASALLQSAFVII